MSDQLKEERGRKTIYSVDIVKPSMQREGEMFFELILSALLFH